MVAEVRPDADITSEEIWRAALPGDFRGATKTDRLWHLYYGQDPGYVPGASISIDLADRVKESGSDIESAIFFEAL